MIVDDMSVIVVVTTEPRTLKGKFACEIKPKGLTLIQGMKTMLEIPVGSNVEYLGKNRMSIMVDNMRLEFSVMKFGGFQNRLARDIAAFVAGEREPPVPRQYVLPWYFYAVAAMVLPIMFSGGAIPMMAGFGLAGACFAIAQREEWSITVRLLFCVGIIIAAYTLLFLLLSMASRG
jgi:hypothetical protein